MYSGKHGSIRAKLVVFGQSGGFGNSGCIQEKVVVFKQIGCILAKVVVLGKKYLNS